ncbi:glycosyltransferase family 2 protein [Tessaracoccus sp. Z1128]
MTSPTAHGAVPTHPLVTALVPTYNGAAFIQRTLDSLAAQTWPHLEILIGDDCSTDDTLNIVSAFAEGRDDTRVVRRITNLGWLANSNDLMSRAHGEFMFFAFHDDVIAPEYTERLAAALLSAPDAVLAFSDMTVTQVDGSVTTHVFDDLSSRRWAAGRGIALALRPPNWWVPNRGVFRSSAYRRVGGIHRNESGEYSADWTWLLHLSLLGRFIRVPVPMCHKFYTVSSLSKTWAHDPEHRTALLRAGVAEVNGSSTSAVTRLVVLCPLLFSLYAPSWLRDLAKRVMGMR